MDNNRSVRDAPQTLVGTLAELGPGLIIAGSIVGSGELIATTLTGAAAGFWLMWLILLGCTIKVFAQLELGRYTLTSGRTTLDGLSSLPGPSPGGVHWIVWLWMIMFTASIGQQGGIVGAVGQSISIAVPLSQEGKAFNEAASHKVRGQIDDVVRAARVAQGESTATDSDEATAPVASETPRSSGLDVYVWALLLTVITSMLLYFGRYGVIEKIVMVLVGGFTVVSLANLVMLQRTEVWAVHWSDIRQGLSFRLPPARPGIYPIATALATFGLIGMSAGELVFYPYWCQEKGYARYVGPREETAEWHRRAKDWIRVMHWDAWLSMAVYTFSTVIFYLLGAAVLSRADLQPKGMDLIRTLAAMYEPVFGSLAVGVFLVGAVSVLYSTFLVASASNALVLADAIDIFNQKLSKPKPAWSKRRTRPLLGLALPIIGFIMFVFFPEPKLLILLTGVTQTFLLPVLAFSALYFRYNYVSSEMQPGRIWDACLWLSALALLVVGLWLAFQLSGMRF